MTNIEKNDENFLKNAECWVHLEFISVKNIMIIEKLRQSVFVCLVFCYFRVHLRHVEVPRPGVELELQLPAYTTATATLDLSCVCHLHHSSRQCGILNPLSKARDRTRILMDPSCVR